jgi:hypothetical protein
MTNEQNATRWVRDLAVGETVNVDTTTLDGKPIRASVVRESSHLKVSIVVPIQVMWTVSVEGVEDSQLGYVVQKALQEATGTAQR